MSALGHYSTDPPFCGFNLGGKQRLESHFTLEKEKGRMYDMLPVSNYIFLPWVVDDLAKWAVPNT